MTHKFFSAVAGTMMALAMIAPAGARDALTEPTTRIVRYDDLNLASAKGRERFETRLRMAANSACGMSNAREMVERMRAKKCRDAALERTRPQFEQAVRQAGEMMAGRRE
jgi:UrcA family protein